MCLKRSSFIISVLFISTLLMTGCGSKDKVDPGKIAEYNKPAVVYIETWWQGKVSYPAMQVRQDALAKYYRKVYSSRMSQEEIMMELLNEIADNPEIYLAPDMNTITEKEVMSGASGSGFIITSDGYVITNAHVVKVENDELKQMIIMQALNEQINQDIVDMVKDMQQMGIKLSSEQRQKLVDAAASFYLKYMTLLTKPIIYSYVNLGVAVPGYGNVKKGYIAEIKKVGDPVPGKDVAILKINTNNLPVAIMSHDKVTIQDRVIAMGYPGPVTKNPMLTKDVSNLLPTATAGTISSFKKMVTGGWEVYQHDVAITHGNSGGPLFNEKGEVIGINTFGSTQYNSQTGGYDEVQGFNFAIPSTIIEEFTNEINLKISEEKLTEQYHKAIDLYFDNHFAAASDVFKDVLDASSSFPYAQEMKEKCIAEINAGRNVGMFPYTLALGGVIIILAVVFAATPKLRQKLPVFNHKSSISESAPKEVEAMKTAVPLKEAQQHFCTNCGAKLDKNDRFCSSCGTKVS
jgi:serine protease Do